jgi:hypothetical protein
MGLNFDRAGTLCGQYNRAGFFLSYGAIQDFFQDPGGDLSMIQLTASGSTYEANITQLVADLENPIDPVLVDNKIYVIEFGFNEGRVIEIRLPTTTSP